MPETRNCARKRRSPAEQILYDSRMEAEQRERNQATRRNAVGGVVYRRKHRGRGMKNKGKGKGKADDGPDNAEGSDSPSATTADGVVDSELFISSNSSSIVPESSDSLIQEAEDDSGLYKSTNSTPMGPESDDEGDEDESDGGSSKLSEDSSSSLGVEPAVDSDIYNETSSKSEQLEEESTNEARARAVTQSQMAVWSGYLSKEMQERLAVAPDEYPYIWYPEEEPSMKKWDISHGKPPITSRFVTANGTTFEAIPTLPGKSYCSDGMQDPAFEPDPKNSSVSYRSWNGDCEQLLLPDEEMVARYDQFFSAGMDALDEKFEAEQVTARVGVKHITMKDLKSLGPGEWIDGDIIDRMAEVLQAGAGKSLRRVAVFDTNFKIINEHPASTDPAYCRWFYNYDRVRKNANRKLRGWSPMNTDCMIFPTNVGMSHWILIIVYPKERHIVTLDSQHNGCRVEARTILRWLFDETSYNYPAEVDKLFLPHIKDMGWTFKVDTDVKRQVDGFNCGVFCIGYIACVLYKMNPRRLTPMMVQGFRKRLFGEFCSKRINMDDDPICIKRHETASWITGGAPRITLSEIPTAPLSPGKALRATSSSTRLVLPSERVKLSAKGLRERSEGMRLARVTADAELKAGQAAKKAEKKREKAEADQARIAELKEEIAEKVRMVESRLVADAKVDALLQTGGLAAELKRKDKKHNSRMKALMERHFFEVDPLRSLFESDPVPGEEESSADPDPNKPDHVASLAFRRGYYNVDPPNPNVKNPRCGPTGKKIGPKYWYEYNYFEGKSADGVLFKYQLNPAWCEYIFELVFTQLCRREPGRFFHVPIGSSNIDEEPTVRLQTDVVVRYPQRDMDYCLPYAVASCLSYMGYVLEAQKVAAAAPDLIYLPGDVVIRKLRTVIQDVLPEMGQCMIFNKLPGQRRKKNVKMTVEDIIRYQTPYLTVVSPKGVDGSADHAVCVVDDMVFDARLGYGLKLCMETFMWVCGPRGVSELGTVYRFCLPYGVKKRNRERDVQRNW